MPDLPSGGQKITGRVVVAYMPCSAALNYYLVLDQLELRSRIVAPSSPIEKKREEVKRPAGGREKTGRWT